MGTLAASLQSNLPAGVSVIGFHDEFDSGAEIGLLIIDFEAPFVTLEEGNILRLSFVVATTANGTADVRFTNPGPQILDLLGQVLSLDEVASGGVLVRP